MHLRLSFVPWVHSGMQKPRNMKNLAVFLLFLALGFWACDKGGGSTSKESPSALDLSNYTVVDIPGTDFQQVFRYDQSGNLVEQGLVRNGKRTGTWVTYHPGKQVPKSIISYVDDKFNGIYMELSQRGQVEKIMNFLNNNWEGRYAEYKSGWLLKEGTYKNGQLDGVYREYFQYKDVPQKEVHYKDGKLHGPYRFYNEEGKVMVQGEYKNGEKVSGGIVENQQ